MTGGADEDVDVDDGGVYGGGAGGGLMMESS